MSGNGGYPTGYAHVMGTPKKVNLPIANRDGGRSYLQRIYLCEVNFFELTTLQGVAESIYVALVYISLVLVTRSIDLVAHEIFLFSHFNCVSETHTSGK
jgi:hypothetical protein